MLSVSHRVCIYCRLSCRSFALHHASSDCPKPSPTSNISGRTPSSMPRIVATAITRHTQIIHELRQIDHQLQPSRILHGTGPATCPLSPNISSSHTPIGSEPTLVEYLNFDAQSPPAWVHRPDPSRSHVSIGSTLASSTLPALPPRQGGEACGFQPRDQNNEQQIWAIEQSGKGQGQTPALARATAEIPLAAMHAGRDLEPSTLPLKLVGPSRCYRAEAGARGVDTKGLYRVHEFTKIEMFGWADNVPASSSIPSSDDLFNELLTIQKEILTSLRLPCRVLEMPTTDLGASASRKLDIEALFPSRMRGETLEDAWGEVTSASICTDYQSRRLGTRVRGGTAKDSRFPHTVNGTAIAVPRVLAAILENGWDAERGVVVIPEVLRPWMGGMEVIGK
ncbi:hypothetical protein P175DRAFT_0505461 [Aspergillus ochraceoroseus IBT 24754]|uniref:serine--tRNA ligase n=1 Tax=Aspergillus ochraceoroseus IBT 24754 TaxID=1392256 RepID=A0A2T5LKK3_9EURO|nr:uncharacterized protein P175DRAFT_0505461 [Aspergillus ochraceoroseus IBT 24754]PTU16808.1 hypothetical protein P175DRAFT_0505461 [Aspergillus ochraceoroseus IBT 24754]